MALDTGSGVVHRSDHVRRAGRGGDPRSHRERLRRRAALEVRVTARPRHFIHGEHCAGRDRAGTTRSTCPITARSTRSARGTRTRDRPRPVSTARLLAALAAPRGGSPSASSATPSSGGDPPTSAPAPGAPARAGGTPASPSAAPRRSAGSQSAASRAARGSRGRSRPCAAPVSALAQSSLERKRSMARRSALVGRPAPRSRTATRVSLGGGGGV